MTFVVVNYGEKQQKLFNPYCQTRFLIENIKERCNYPKEIEVELSDEQGNLKHICHAGNVYANSLLNVERENLILLQIKRIQSNKKCSDKKDVFSKNSDNIIYTPLLKNEKIITTKFTARLSSKDDLHGNRNDIRTPRKGKDKKNRRSLDRSESSNVVPHPNTPNSNRKRASGSRASSRSKSRGK